MWQMLHMELPPRARRIPFGPAQTRPKRGTTSACAENTKHRSCGRCCIWNYLRVRGEYPLDPRKPDQKGELPPRARRIPGLVLLIHLFEGTTSACAENTKCTPPNRSNKWNYLRVRGEYLPTLRIPRPNPELPPRARRIQIIDVICDKNPGTTSACAENTRNRATAAAQHWNYLRVRGEYPWLDRGRTTAQELPPRARRIRSRRRLRSRPRGTTSACAENTLNELGLL